MAELRSFRGYRYSLQNPQEMTALIAPPYDMLSPERIEALYQKHPLNAVRIDSNRKLSEDTTNRDRHERAATLFAEWISRGKVSADEQPSIYVYEQHFTAERAGTVETFKRTGIIALVKLVDFSEGVILPHEYTLSGPKIDRYEHLDATRLNVGQIFGLLSDNEGTMFALIQRMKTGPAIGIAVDDDNVRHVLYQCRDSDLIERLKTEVKESTILIADGHHRYETALSFFRDHNGNPAYSHLMMTLVSMADPGLIIRSFHRLIRRREHHGAVSMKQELERYFSVIDCGVADSSTVNAFLASTLDAGMLYCDSATKRLFGLTLSEQGEKYLQSTMPERSLRWKHLDTALINLIVVNAILKLPLDGTVLHDVVEYDNDVAAAVQKCLSNETYYGGFFIRPVDIAEIHGIVQGGERMPQKSTNFYPKVYSGLIFNMLENH